MTGRAATARSPLSYLAIGLIAVTGYYLIPPHGPGLVLRVVIYCAASTSAAVAVLYGIRRNRPRPALPWLLIGLSQAVYAAADANFYIAHYVLRLTTYPSVADALYLAHYPLVVAGLILLIRRRTPGRDLPGLLDAAVLAAVAGMLSWLYLIGPQTHLAAPILTKMASLAYPVMDLGLLAVSLRLVMGAGRRPASFFLLTGNLAAMLAADTVYVGQQLAGTYHAGNFLDAIWLTGNLLLGAAALHPTMAGLGEPSPATDVTLGPARIAALCAAALIAPATLVVQDIRGQLRDIPVVAGVCALLFILTIARLAGLVADQRRLATTDALTGLRTRRYLEAKLPAELARARRGGGSLAVFIVDVDHFKAINDGYGHQAGDQALIEIAGRLGTAARSGSGDVLARYGGEEFALLAPGAGADELFGIAERLRHCVANAPVQVSDDTWITVTVSVGTASYPQHGDTESQLVEIADRALYTAKNLGRNRVVVGEATEPAAPTHTDQTAAICYLCRLADQVDERLSCQEHSHAVSRWCALVAAELGHDDATVRRAELAGRLHDIGKIVVPETVLTNPGALSEEEWRLLRAHPEHGFELARALPALSEVADVIRQHHERFDGTGYPAGLAGARIRFEARVLAVCDAWAAMRSDRAYQPPLPVEAAVQELRLGRGSQFDPEVVEAFLGLFHRGLVGELAPASGRGGPPETVPAGGHRAAG